MILLLLLGLAGAQNPNSPNVDPNDVLNCTRNPGTPTESLQVLRTYAQGWCCGVTRTLYKNKTTGIESWAYNYRVLEPKACNELQEDLDSENIYKSATCYAPLPRPTVAGRVHVDRDKNLACLCTLPRQHCNSRGLVDAFGTQVQSLMRTNAAPPTLASLALLAAALAALA